MTPSKSIFDAQLPTIDYHGVQDPGEAHRIIARVRQQAPIALSPFGPEILSHDLVRAVLHDPRFATQQGFGLAIQGITSGPLWDRLIRLMVSLDGAAHLRLRRLVAPAFTPRAAARVRTACRETITELI